MSANIMEIKNVTKKFGSLTAVNDVSFGIRKGEILGLIGPNGSGKTTLVNCLTGIYKKDSGKVTMYDKDLSKLRPDEVCRMGVARTFQIVLKFPKLSVLESLRVAHLFGNPKSNPQEADKTAIEMMKLFNLYELRDTLSKNLTLFQLKALSLACAMTTKPKVLMLDEFFSGLNPSEIDEAMGVIRKINEGGVTLLVIEHIMRVIMNLCNRIIVIDYGKKIADGSPQEISNDKHVIEAYLGEEYSSTLRK